MIRYTQLKVYENVCIKTPMEDAEMQIISKTCSSYGLKKKRTKMTIKNYHYHLKISLLIQIQI